jgi:N-acetylglutamate synthase-like GNAT family acetyltransferase
MFQIRRIKPEDIGFVMEVTSINGYSRGKLLSNIQNFMICEDVNIKCGCGCIVFLNGKGYISWLTVIEGHRRQKLGDALARALLNIADLKGIDEVYGVGICEDFMKAMGFEKENNSTVMDVIKDVIGETEASDYFRVLLDGYFKPCSQK